MLCIQARLDVCMADTERREDALEHTTLACLVIQRSLLVGPAGLEF